MITSIIIVISIIIFLIIMTMIIVKKSYLEAFNIRIDNVPLVYKLLKEKNKNLKRTKFEYINSENVKLVGYFYFLEEQTKFKGLIINSHGYENNKESQLPKLIEFIKEGYLVFSYDNTGVSDSEGDSVIGLGHSVIDLRDTINTLAKMNEINKLPFVLHGHSWGGFAVCATNNFLLEKKITAIISKAGFNTPREQFLFQAQQIVGRFGKIVVPAIMKIENKRVNINENISGLSGLQRTDAKCLIIHSEDDSIVPFKITDTVYREGLKDKDNIEILTLKNHEHMVDQKIETLKLVGKVHMRIKGKLTKEDEYEYAMLLINGVDYGVLKKEIEFVNKCIAE